MYDVEIILVLPSARVTGKKVRNYESIFLERVDRPTGDASDFYALSSATTATPIRRARSPLTSRAFLVTGGREKKKQFNDSAVFAWCRPV